MNLSVSEGGVAEFLTGTGAGLLGGVTISSAFIRPLGTIPFAVACTASLAVIAAGLRAHRLAFPGTWVPPHDAAPEGRARRAAVAALSAARVWDLLPGIVQAVFCGCPSCKGTGGRAS